MTILSIFRMIVAGTNCLRGGSISAFSSMVQLLVSAASALPFILGTNWKEKEMANSLTKRDFG